MSSLETPNGRSYGQISSAYKLPGDETWLIIRIDDGDKSVKYQFSNAPPDTGVERFAPAILIMEWNFVWRTLSVHYASN